MKNQRQFTRKSVSTHVSIFLQDDAQYIGTLADYSEGGIMVSSYQPVAVGKVFHFTMVDIPNNIGQKRSGVIEVESVWSHQLNPTLFGTGFKLLNLDEKAAAMFLSYDQWQQQHA